MSRLDETPLAIKDFREVLEIMRANDRACMLEGDSVLR